MLANIKSIIKQFIPSRLLVARRRYLREKAVIAHDVIFHDKEPRDIFSEIYANAMWGKVQDTDSFCSGHGSHLSAHVTPYVAAVSDFLRTFNPLLNIVDLGCGDFNVGSQVRRYCADYVACDIVPSLIERNKVKFNSLNVDFRVVNIIEDQLPTGDVVILRQVLQHLSNEHIKQVVKKLYGYKFMILTEFIPEGDFTPNINQPTGSFSRIARGIKSGIILTAEPFALKVKSERVICQTSDPDGLITVVVYELKENA